MTELQKLNINYNQIDFSEYSHQFATVDFDRAEDEETVLITIIQNGLVKQFKGDNKFNPSGRRQASCVYLKEESGDKIIKICTIQHKGNTFVELHDVSDEETKYLFS